MVCDKRTVSVGRVQGCVALVCRHVRCCVCLLALGIVLCLLYMNNTTHDWSGVDTVGVSSSVIGLSDLPNIIRQYCVFAHDSQQTLNGTEGHAKVNSKLILRSVLLMTRHGERSPIYVGDQPATRTQMDCSLNDGSLTNTYDQFAQFADQHNLSALFNISSDSVLSKWPLVSNRVKCRAGHMTAAGTVQHVQLGTYLRQQYAPTAMFAKDSSWSFTTYSTDYGRTLQSGVALAYGLLYDPFRGHVHPVPHLLHAPVEHFCNLYGFVQSPLCSAQCLSTRLRLRAKELVARQEYLQQTHPDTYRMFVTVRDQVLGMNTTLMPSAIALFDYMMGRHACRLRPLPCDTLGQARCAQWTQILQLYDSIRSIEKSVGETEWMQQLTLLEAHPILHIVNQLSNPTNQHRVLHLSGHDVTLKPVIHALRLFTGHIPKYRERLVFELYEHLDIQYLRIVWKGKDVTAKMPFCEKSVKQVEGVGLCAMSVFNKWIENALGLSHNRNLTSTCEL